MTTSCVVPFLAGFFISLGFGDVVSFPPKRDPERSYTNLHLFTYFLYVLDCELGHVTEIDAMSCARVCGQLGGSRYKASDVIDPAVGIVIRRHVGSHVNEGKQPLNPAYLCLP